MPRKYLKLAVAAIYLLCALPCSAQTYNYPNDVFGGNTVVRGSAHAHSLTIVSITQNSGSTTQTVVANNASGYLFAVNEPMYISGTGVTALNTAFVNNTTSAGASIITSTNCTVSGAQILSCPNTTNFTLTAPSAAGSNLSASAGLIAPARYNIQTITTPFGTGPQFVTPLDNWQWLEAIGCASDGQGCGAGAGLEALIQAKFGGTFCTGVREEQISFVSLNFNGIAPLSDTGYSPTASGNCPTNQHLPFWNDVQTGLYSSANLNGYVSQPLHNVSVPHDSNWTCGGASHAVGDFFDPRFQTFQQAYMLSDAPTINAFKSPWTIGHSGEDTDFNGMPNAGWQFHSYLPLQVNDCDYAWKVAVSSPVQTLSTSQPYGGGMQPPFIYPDPLIYTKTPAASPPATCSLTTPCTLSDFLSKEYGTIGALNTAWGSSYTTFGSSGTGIGWTFSWLASSSGTPELLCTGAGSSRFCNHTLASTVVSPYSVMIYITPGAGILGPTPFAGDDGAGNLKNAGPFHGSTGYPLNSVFMDSNGNIEQVTTAGTTGSSFTGPGTCTGIQTTVTGTATVTCLGPGIGTTGSIVYSTGAISITLSANSNTGATYNANYIANGWPTGSGLLDENARSSHHAWTGSEGMCIVTLPDYQVGHAYNVYDEFKDTASSSWQVVTVAGISGAAPAFTNTLGDIKVSGATFQSIGHGVCQTGGDFAPPNAGATFATDTTTWEGQMAAQYFKTWKGTFTNVFPDIPYGCADNLGTWQTPPRGPVLDAAQVWCDWAYDQGSLMDTALDSQSLLKYGFMTTHFQKPLVLFETPVSTQSNKGCGGNSPCLATQQLRGQEEYTITNNLLHTLGATGIFQSAGYVHWGSHDFVGGQNANFGFKTQSDNLYDGNEDVIAVTACSIPLQLFNCGNEASGIWNGTTMFSGAQNLKSGLGLWFSVAPKPPAPCIAQCFTFNVPAGSLHTDPNVCPVHCGVVTYCGAGDGYWVYDATCKWSKFPTGSFPTTATITIPAQPAQTITGKVQ
jgi:hypothetical protein